MAHVDLTDEQVVHQALQAERDLVATRFKLKSNSLEDSSKLKSLRRNIARLRTEARRREIAAGLPKDSLLSKHSGSFVRASEAGSGSVEKGGFLSGIVDKLTGKE